MYKTVIPLLLIATFAVIIGFLTGAFQLPWTDEAKEKRALERQERKVNLARENKNLVYLNYKGDYLKFGGAVFRLLNGTAHRCTLECPRFLELIFPPQQERIDAQGWNVTFRYVARFERASGVIFEGSFVRKPYASTLDIKREFERVLPQLAENAGYCYQHLEIIKQTHDEIIIEVSGVSRME